MRKYLVESENCLRGGCSGRTAFLIGRKVSVSCTHCHEGCCLSWEVFASCFPEALLIFTQAGWPAMQGSGSIQSCRANRELKQTLSFRMKEVYQERAAGENLDAEYGNNVGGPPKNRRAGALQSFWCGLNYIKTANSASGTSRWLWKSHVLKD